MSKCIFLIIKSWTEDDRVKRSIPESMAAKLSKYNIQVTRKVTDLTDKGICRLNDKAISVLDKIVNSSNEVRCIATRNINDGIAYTTEGQHIVKYYPFALWESKILKTKIGRVNNGQTVSSINFVKFQGNEYVIALSSDLSSKGFLILPSSPFAYEIPLISHNSHIVSWKDRILYIGSTEDIISNRIGNFNDSNLVSLGKDEFKVIVKCKTFLTIGDNLYYIHENKIIRHESGSQIDLKVRALKICHGPNKSLIIGGMKENPGEKSKQFVIFSRFLKVIDTLDHSDVYSDYTTVDVLKCDSASFVIGMTKDCRYTMAAILRRRLFMIREDRAIYESNKLAPSLMRTSFLPGKSALCIICSGLSEEDTTWKTKLYMLYPDIIKAVRL